MLRIKLAGYNVDADVLRELHAYEPGRNDITPEILSAAYARISRDPRSVDELRDLARQEVEKARTSNQRIIFQMGHHSVAEHAVFNFDIIGVSRLALEELEHFRLCSFTEKSQRYITLNNAFVIPEEIKKTPYEKKFCEMVRRQFKYYDKLFIALKKHVIKKNPELASNPKKLGLLEGWAKEDARYITPLATEAQMGFTVNARNLELILRRFASHSSKEIQAVGRALYRQMAHIAPSIILFHQANDFDQKTYPELEGFFAQHIKNNHREHSVSDETVSLIRSTPDADTMVLNALLHTVSTDSFSDIAAMTGHMGGEQRKDIVRKALHYLEFYDTVPREFEYVHALYELIISSACFGQLKRHRMATITTQSYDPELGVVIPESIKQIGMTDEFLDIATETNILYAELKRNLPSAAPYILTNAHRRRLLINVNARELYHISRLREDLHAQWEIRQIASAMCEKAKEVMPLTMLLIGGKHEYSEIYKKIYGKYPNAALPEESEQNKVEINQ